jgi:hypothetical protein
MSGYPRSHTATRYDKIPSNFLAGINLAVAVDWLN